MEKWLITIQCVKYMKGELYEYRYEVECENLINVCRIVMTYKPRRGYTVDSFHVKMIETLV